MLLQSHAGEIELLPALPGGWLNGKVEGLRARGGFTVDMAWNSGRITVAVIAASSGGLCPLRHGSRAQNTCLEAGANYVFRP
jgi:alpha-L-fucosidase 2